MWQKRIDVGSEKSLKEASITTKGIVFMSSGSSHMELGRCYEERILQVDCSKAKNLLER